MHILIRNRIRKLYNEGFSISELAIMYNVANVKIERVLEYST